MEEIDSYALLDYTAKQLLDALHEKPTKRRLRRTTSVAATSGGAGARAGPASFARSTSVERHEAPTRRVPLATKSQSQAGRRHDHARQQQPVSLSETRKEMEAHEELLAQEIGELKLRLSGCRQTHASDRGSVSSQDRFAHLPPVVPIEPETAEQFAQRPVWKPPPRGQRTTLDGYAGRRASANFAGRGDGGAPVEGEGSGNGCGSVGPSSPSTSKKLLLKPSKSAPNMLLAAMKQAEPDKWPANQQKPAVPESRVPESRRHAGDTGSSPLGRRSGASSSGGLGGAHAGTETPGSGSTFTRCSSWHVAAAGVGMSRAAAKERARTLRSRVTSAAKEATSEQQRKRDLVRERLARLRVDTPQFAAGRDLPPLGGADVLADGPHLWDASAFGAEPALPPKHRPKPLPLPGPMALELPSIIKNPVPFAAAYDDDEAGTAVRHRVRAMPPPSMPRQLSTGGSRLHLVVPKEKVERPSTPSEHAFGVSLRTRPVSREARTKRPVSREAPAAAAAEQPKTTNNGK